MQLLFLKTINKFSKFIDNWKKKMKMQLKLLTSKIMDFGKRKIKKFNAFGSMQIVAKEKL